MIYLIYGKHSSNKTFKAMDVNAGYRVNNLIYATMLSKEQADRFMEREAPNNQDWKFKVVTQPSEATS